MMAYGRITYNGINIDLNKGFNQFQVQKIANSVISRAQSGVSQVVNFYEQEFLELLINTLDPQLQCELDEFFEYVLDGNIFSLEFNRDIVFFSPFENSINNKYDGTTGTWTKTAVTDASSYIDSNGLIKFQNTSNTPRYQAGKYGKGLLIETASTNYCTRSETIGGTGWTVSGYTVTADTTETLDPFGTNTASKVVYAGGGNFYFDTGVTLGTNDISASVWAKGLTASDNLVIVLTTSTTSILESQQFSLTTEWARYDFNYTSVSSETGTIRVAMGPDSGDTIYMAAAQIELKNFATSYIRADSGSTVTRNADVYDPFDVSSIVNSVKGTVSFWMKPFADPANMTTSEFYFEIRDVTNGETFLRCTVGSSIGSLMRDAGDTQNYTTTASPLSTYITQNEWHHIVVTYDTTISNGLNLYVNGVLIDTSSNSAFAPVIPEELTIGIDNANTLPANGIFDDFFISRDVKDATWVNNTYNRRNGLGIRRGKWPTLQLSDFANKPNWIPGDKYNYPLMIEEVIT